MANIGILGGTFDPPHNGHLVLAETAMREIQLCKVLFVPARIPPHRSQINVSPAAERMAMLELALKGKHGFEMCTIEFEREGPSYTVDTLTILKQKYPKDELVFLIGADNVSEMEKWHNPEAILRMVRVVAVNRPGYGTTGAYADVVSTLEMPPVDVSSSMIRELVRSGKPIAGMLPLSVETYIKQKGLYK